MLIYFIHHVASSIQADRVVRSIALETIGSQASTREQRQALEQHAAFVLQAGLSHKPPEPDRTDLERAHASALRVTHLGGIPEGSALEAYDEPTGSEAGL